MTDPTKPTRRGWQPLPGKADPVPVRDALDQLASTLGLSSLDAIQQLFLAWPDVVGSELADHCRPLRLERGELTISASDQQWATELSWMTSLLIERCNGLLGTDEVTGVRIRR